MYLSQMEAKHQKACSEGIFINNNAARGAWKDNIISLVTMGWGDATQTKNYYNERHIS